MAYAGVSLKLTCDYLKVAFNAVRGVSQQVRSPELVQPFVALAARLQEAARSLDPHFDEQGRLTRCRHHGSVKLSLSEAEAVFMVLAARAAYGILEAHARQLGHQGAGAARAAYPDVAPALVVLAAYVVEEAKTAGYDISPAALHEP